jgi:HD-GYP domain-containing protein (c-di-GMP phosphodiesterase class II)
MVSDRMYRKGLPLEEAIRRLRSSGGTQFDSDVVRFFTGIALQDSEEVKTSV